MGILAMYMPLSIDIFHPSLSTKASSGAIFWKLGTVRPLSIVIIVLGNCFLIMAFDNPSFVIIFGLHHFKN